LSEKKHENENTHETLVLELKSLFKKMDSSKISLNEPCIHHKYKCIPINTFSSWTNHHNGLTRFTPLFESRHWGRYCKYV